MLTAFFYPLDYPFTVKRMKYSYSERDFKSKNYIKTVFL